MANTARKLKETREGYGKPVIKIGKQIFNDDIPAALGKNILKGYEIKNKIEMLKQELDQVNALIIEETSDYMSEAESGSCRVQYFGTEAHVVFRESVEITDHIKLKQVLGDRFEDLVDVRLSYKPEKKLLEQALSDEDILAERIRDCLTVKETKASVSYKQI